MDELRKGPNGEAASSTSRWHFFGREFPRSEVVFVCQILLIYIVVCVSVYNLTVGTGNDKLWITFLSSCIGYTLPNPKIKRDG